MGGYMEEENPEKEFMRIVKAEKENMKWAQ